MGVQSAKGQVASENSAPAGSWSAQAVASRAMLASPFASSDDGPTIRAELRPLSMRGTPVAEDLAEHIAELAQQIGASLILLDGPQAWKGAANQLPHCRLCERLLNTPAKTGLPGCVKPANYRPFVEFSIRVFDELERRGWPRLSTPDPRGEHVTIESFPYASWKRLKVQPLPAKAKCGAHQIDQSLRALKAIFPLEIIGEVSHDGLQALIAGLAGITMQAGFGAYEFLGEAPYIEAGSVREGFIAVPSRTGVAKVVTRKPPLESMLAEFDAVKHAGEVGAGPPVGHEFDAPASSGRKSRA